MHSHQIRHYLTIFLLALALRLLLLGTAPLSDTEALWALQAHQIAAGEHPPLGAQIAYIHLTAALFYLFQSTNFLARLVPALTGAALTWFPYLFRKRLRPAPGLLLSIFLALDPGLVALSRQAGSPILALTFALFALAFWDNDRPRPAGLFVGLALLSGAALWPGLLGLGLTWGLWRAWLSPQFFGETIPSPPKDRKTALAYAGGVLLLLGSLFLLSPAGLTAWLNGLPAYLRGWWAPSYVPAWRLPVALLTYEPLALGLALVGGLRAWLENRLRFRLSALWLLSALLLALLYPGRQVSDLGWALIPLWGLAALELARHLQVPKENRLETWSVAALTVVLLGFAWLDLLGFVRLSWPSPEASARLILFIGALLLLIISLFLIGMGWSAQIAKGGGLYGLLIIFGIYTLGAAWGTSGLRTPGAIELWDPAPQPAQAHLLAQTVSEISEWSSGDKQAQPVTIIGVNSPALEWLLRRHSPQVHPLLNPAAAPPLVITRSGENLQQSAVYRGQDFGWNWQAAWDEMDALTWLRWMTLRTAPVQTENLILWVRDDLFIDRSR